MCDLMIGLREARLFYEAQPDAIGLGGLQDLGGISLQACLRVEDVAPPHPIDKMPTQAAVASAIIESVDLDEYSGDIAFRLLTPSSPHSNALYRALAHPDGTIRAIRCEGHASLQMGFDGCCRPYTNDNLQVGRFVITGGFFTDEEVDLPGDNDTLHMWGPGGPDEELKALAAEYPRQLVAV